MIYTVTAVHNRIEITRRFIGCLNEQNCRDRIRLILVDDGCTDGTADMARAQWPSLTVLEGDGNLYWGGALHMAWRHLMQMELQDDDVIFFVNDDSRLCADFLEKAQEILKRNPNDLLTGCAYGVNSGLYMDGPVWFDLKNGAVKLLPAGSSGNCASTRALLLTARVFKELGGFHPVLLPHYASDYEYTIRAYKKGHKIISSQELNYRFSEDTTGDNSHKNLSLKKIMSKRSKLNPFYKLSFILLIAPIWRLPAYIAYQLRHFGRHDRDCGKAV